MISARTHGFFVFYWQHAGGCHSKKKRNIDGATHRVIR